MCRKSSIFLCMEPEKNQAVDTDQGEQHMDGYEPIHDRVHAGSAALAQRSPLRSLTALMLATDTRSRCDPAAGRAVAPSAHRLPRCGRDGSPECPAVQDRTGQGLISKAQTLTLDQCVDIALKKNPEHHCSGEYRGCRAEAG